MDSPRPPLDDAKRSHWIVGTHYRFRAASFALIFIGLALEYMDKAPGAWLWALLVLQFLVYPQLVYLRASRAADPAKAESENLLLDSLFIGLSVATLHFPLWPTFTMWLCSSLNTTLTSGWKGTLTSLAAFLAGVLVASLLGGVHFAPDTGWPTTLLSLLGAAAYVIAIGNTAHYRNQQLRATREKLRQGEHALHVGNEQLQHQLEEIQLLQEKLKEQAVRDPMTGLFNRRYLDTIVPHELARCARDRMPLCMVMLDIDHFKHVNDTYGHGGGDEVLKALASLLIDSVRASDVACRYGGEEFLLVLPNMPLKNALLRAEQWRAAFAALSVTFGGLPISATVSIGIACGPEDGSTPDQLMRSADLALYRAKARGRDCVVSFGDAVVAPVPATSLSPVQELDRH
ncbi:MAG: diguanylate cyclase [Pseudomonadota bacterium]